MIKGGSREIKTEKLFHKKRAQGSVIPRERDVKLKCSRHAWDDNLIQWYRHFVDQNCRAIKAIL